MNFDVSSTKLNLDFTPINAATGNRIKLKTVDVPELDYSDLEIDDFYRYGGIDPAALAGMEIGKWLAKQDYSRIFPKGGIDFIFNTGCWVVLKGDFAKTALPAFIYSIGAFGSKLLSSNSVEEAGILNRFSNSLSNISGSVNFGAVSDGIFKVILATLAGQEIFSMSSVSTFAKGFTKNLSSKEFSSYFSQNFKISNCSNFIKELSKFNGLRGNLSQEAIDHVLETASPEAIEAFMKEVDAAKYFASTFAKNAVNTLGVGVIVEYGATMVSSLAGNLISGKPIDFESLKYGSNLLMSSSKIICAFAFETVFSALGCPALGKTVGTIVGVAAGNFAVSLFDSNEDACFIAGIGAFVGAAAGIISVSGIAMAATSALVGAALVAGAAVVGAAAAISFVVVVYNIFAVR